MNAINLEQARAAYEVGLRQHDEESYGISEALKDLAKTELNESSAASLVYAVSWLLNGEEYHRVLCIPVTDAYLKWIREDRGDAAHGNAIWAVTQHIKYYEKKRKVRRPGLRKLVQQHQSLLKQESPVSILLEFKDPSSKGYFDVFPLNFFTQEGTQKEVVHTVRSRKGAEYQAKCDINTDSLTATLDYAAYPEFNTAQGMFLGTSRIHFLDSDRTHIHRLEWKGKEDSSFQEVPFGTSTFELAPAAPYQPSQEGAKTSTRNVRERPNQATFKMGLKILYKERCCVTGCQIKQVLEGAHIDPFSGPASDNLKNGLLLRADIHTLFDRHLLAVNPDDYTIQLASELEGEPSYSPLRGKSIQLPDRDDFHPDREALRRHWKQFNSTR